MNHKKCLISYAISTLVTFAVLWGLEFLVHGVILSGDYKAIAQIYRPEADMCHYLPYMLLSFLILSAAAVWAYDHGKKETPFLGQGVRFGLGLAFLTVVPEALLYYSLQPLGCALVMKQILLGVLQMVVLGVVIAKLRQKTTK